MTLWEAKGAGARASAGRSSGEVCAAIGRGAADGHFMELPEAAWSPQGLPALPADTGPQQPIPLFCLCRARDRRPRGRGGPNRRPGQQSWEDPAVEKDAAGYICSVCRNEVPAIIRPIHGVAKARWLERIKRDHPEWPEADGACPRRIDEHRATLRGPWSGRAW